MGVSGTNDNGVGVFHTVVGRNNGKTTLLGGSVYQDEQLVMRTLVNSIGKCLL